MHVGAASGARAAEKAIILEILRQIAQELFD